MCLIISGCSNSSNEKNDSTGIESQHLVELIDSIPVKDETKSLEENRDTLIGKFDGIHLDTLIAEPLGDPVDIYDGVMEYLKWRVFTKKGTVKDLILDNKTIGIKFVKEGDLNGDGKEEWGYITEWYSSFWRGYNLFTNVNGDWQYMIDSPSIWLSQIDPLDSTYFSATPEDLVQPSKKRNYLNIKFSDIRNDG